MIKSVQLGALLPLAIAASTAHAQVPFTETFENNNAAWGDAAAQPADWDLGGFITADVNAEGVDPQFGSIAFRAQENLGSSNGAFSGIYLADRVNTISFDIRHNSTDALSFYVRLAKPNNFPAVLFVSPVLVEANTWTTVSFAVTEFSPFTVPEGGPGTYQDVLGEVGNLQIGFGAPATQTTGIISFDLDNVSIVPAPSGALLLTGGLGLALRRRR